MGNTHTARVDVAALDAVADAFDDIAALLEQAARTRLTFDGAVAGRAHTADGERLRSALDATLTDLGTCARATAEIGAALRLGARRYLDADRSAAVGIG